MLAKTMKNLFLCTILAVAVIGCYTIKYTKVVERMTQTSVYPTTFKQKIGIEVSEFRPILKVKIKGQFYNFLLATEAEFCSLDSTLANELKLQPLASLKNEYNQAMPFVELDKISIGDIEFSKVAFSTFDYKVYNKLYDCLPIQGMIGSNLLKKSVWQIDYFNEKLTFANHRDSYFFPKTVLRLVFIHI